MAIGSAAIFGCTSTGCPEPLAVSGVYQERVNCDEANMCVIEDEMDTVTVEPDSDDPALFTFTSFLTGLLGQGTLCGARAEWQGAAGTRAETGTWIFDANANTYKRASNYTSNEVSGSCTGNADKLGPPGPPAAVGVCPTGAGGTGGSAGCVPFSTDVGGTEQAPVIWEELYTCIDASGACLGGENVAVSLALVQSAERIDWEIAEGLGEGSRFAGDLCDTSFNWSSEPGEAAEDGCWEFSPDRFNKRSFGPDFYCVGSGSKGAGSSPTPTPSCAQIAAASVDFSACPKAPPASPIENGSTQCDGQLVVMPISNNVTCTPPDLSPCSSCNSYCLDDGFTLGSTSESCEGGFCECGCTYCRPN